MMVVMMKLLLMLMLMLVLSLLLWWLLVWMFSGTSICITPTTNIICSTGLVSCTFHTIAMLHWHCLMSAWCISDVRLMYV